MARGEVGKRPRRAPSLRVEVLEGRELLSGAVAEIVALPAGLKTAGPMAVSNGNLWVAETDANGVAKLGKITTSGFRTEVALPGGAGGVVGGMTADAAGNVWYTLAQASGSGSSGSVGRVNRDGTVSDFPLAATSGRPDAATIGADGNVWVAVTNDVKATSTETGGPVVSALHVNDGTNAGIAPSIAKVAPDGTVISFPVTGAKEARWLTGGPDGNFWFVDGIKVGKMTPAGVVTEFSLPAPADGTPIDLSNAQLTGASDGNLWFIGLGGVSRITPSGDVKTYPTRGVTVTSLSTAVDGNLWFSFLPPTDSPLAYSPNAIIARLTTDGRMNILPDRVDSSGQTVVRMATGHDAGLWLNEADGSFARVNLAGLPTVTAPIIRPTTRSTLTAVPGAELTGTVASFVPNVLSTDSSIPLKYTAVIEWGDGGSSVGTVTPNTRGGFDVAGTHAYNVPAGTSESVKVTVSNVLGDSAVIFNQVMVQAPLTGSKWSDYPAGTTQPKPVTTPVVTPATTPVTPTTTPAKTTATTPAKPTATTTAPAAPPVATPAPVTGTFGTPSTAPLVQVGASSGVTSGATRPTLTPTFALTGRAARLAALARNASQRARAHAAAAGHGQVRVALVGHPRGPIKPVARPARLPRSARY